MALRTRVQPLAADAAPTDDLASRIAATRHGASLAVYPRALERSAELAAAAFAVMHGTPTIETDDLEPTRQVVAVIEALQDAEETQ